MVSRSFSSVLFISAVVLSGSALVACGDDDAPAAPPSPSKGGSGGSSAGAGGANAGSAGATAGSGGTAAGAGGSDAGSGGAAGTTAGAGGSAAGSAGAAGSVATSTGTCKRIADVVGQLDLSEFATVGKASPFCVVGVHAIEGDIGSDYGTVGRLGTSGKLVSNLQGGSGYVVWTPPPSTPENAKQPLAKATEVPVTLTGIPDGAFFGTPSGDDAHAYLSYTGAPPEFAGELFQIALADGKVTGKAAANGLYGVSPGLAANDFFFTGTSNLGAAKADAPNNGVYRGTCAAGACTGKVVKQWGDSSGPIDSDGTGNVFVSHGAFGKDTVVSSFNATSGAESAVGDVHSTKDSILSLAVVAQHVALGKADAATFAALGVSFFSYVPGAPVATLSPLADDSAIKPVGKTTLSVVGGNPAAKELWIIADGNGFDPAGKAVFIRLEPIGTTNLAAARQPAFPSPRPPRSAARGEPIIRRTRTLCGRRRPSTRPPGSTR